MKTYARHYTLKTLVKQFKWQWAMTSEMADKSHAYQLNHNGEVAISTARKKLALVRSSDKLASVFAVTPKGISVLTNYISDPEIESFFLELFNALFDPDARGNFANNFIARQKNYRNCP